MTVTHIPTDTTIGTVVKNDWTWFKSHILSLIVVLTFIVGGIYGVEQLISKHDADNNAKWQAILQTQVAQTQALQTQLTADEQKWSQQNAAAQALIGSLAKAIQERDAQAQQQIKVDATLSASEAAQRLTQQTGAKPNEVQAQGDNVLVDLPVTRIIVSNLDDLVRAQQDLADTQKQLASETIIATNSQAQVVEQKNLVSALQIQITDQSKANQTQIAALKASARKSKLRWFGAGFVSGFILGHIY